MTKLKRIDILGAISLVSAVTLFLVGMSLGGNEQPWSSPIVYGTIIASLVMVVIFILVEKYVAKEPVSASVFLSCLFPFCFRCGGD